MTREIKFRAWFPKEGFMADCHTIACTNGTHTLYSPERTGWFSRKLAGDRFFKAGAGEVVLMQFTGLKDKNGVEIYEGDIIADRENQDERYIVEWGSPQFILQGFPDEEYIEEDFTEGEIIGNIYENPELIKEL